MTSSTHPSGRTWERSTSCKITEVGIRFPIPSFMKIKLGIKFTLDPRKKAENSSLFTILVFSYLSDGANGRVNLKEVDRKLKQLNKPAVKTIHSEDGDIIDCVDIYKQPAFDNPALKNHVIQMRPNFDFKEEKRSTKNESSKLAATLVALGSRYIGAKGDINVWNPSIGSDGVFTTGQIWVKGGPVDDYESLESGWIVHPVQYGDKRTRFFLYWTTGSTSTTGCFDHNCDGFVQISREIALGAAIEPLSRSQTKQLGGVVCNNNVKKTPHTTTAMGSGQFGEALYRKACYVKNIAIVDYYSGDLQYPRWLGTWADETNCYTGSFHFLDFYFGGPGRCPNCDCP
ncbi:uncharacterized protein LOC120163785 [Hibiscus syriacus]|uniref:uncharacterized protein LOC120163785 n=1 Tax=Hibiscus syriacus TaxID=106335 RepID=UPI0019220C27|nr:uncharacterized protein LOC120163785 [Hibiscus syriacus]